jgi:lysozyme family protein
VVTFANTHRGYGNMFRSLDYERPGSSRDQVVRAIDHIIDTALPSWSRYEQVHQKIGVPPEWVFVAHNRESSLNFAKHLHNGDLLTGYTHHVPAGRPQVGHGPPFTWLESAIDALRMKGLQNISPWTIERMLYECERYNGFGYWNRLNSPYVWSWSNKYKGGKIIVDHGPIEPVYDEQCGCAVLFKRLAERRIITLTEEQAVVANAVNIQLPKAIDLAAIEHTFEMINPFLPMLSGFVPAAGPIVLFLETALKAGAAVQQGEQILTVLPATLRALADQLEAMAPAPHAPAALGANQNATS